MYYYLLFYIYNTINHKELVFYRILAYTKHLKIPIISKANRVRRTDYYSD